jgi:hypothetical protein
MGMPRLAVRARVSGRCGPAGVGVLAGLVGLGCLAGTVWARGLVRGGVVG